MHGIVDTYVIYVWILRLASQISTLLFVQIIQMQIYGTDMTNTVQTQLPTLFTQIFPHFYYHRINI